MDLDGTLLKTDTLVESLLLLAREPAGLWGALRAGTRGRASLKAWVAEHTTLAIEDLPLNQALVDWLRAERAAGRRLVLVTAAHRRIADAVAARLGLFDEVMASEGDINLKGKAKAAALVARFGERGFDYAGDAPVDLAVWKVARQAIVVGGPALQRAAAQVSTLGRVFAPESPWRALLRALRLHQWVKNLLIFVPLIAAHQVSDAGALLKAGLAFLAFGLTASAVYLINDLLDLPDDRRHPSKCRRPFAAGSLPLLWGAVLVPALLAAALSLSLLALPGAFLIVLALYFVLTAAYSLRLKRMPIIDVLTLAGLYTLRVIAGAAAVLLAPSFWLLAFSIFIFLSLALAKRHTELRMLRERGELTASGRGWHVEDLSLVQSLGIAAGLSSVQVMALYIDSAAARKLYATPEALWLICPLLLYWICRLWFKAHRGKMHDDPVVFALRDRISLLVGVMTVGVTILATVGWTP
ncbi:MAG: UbiA family prenyltransferase [Xanthomonadales bacterium]|nr:UbiA family prenyltransferase [Xanthomonadales bacterium]